MPKTFRILLAAALAALPACGAPPETPRTPTETSDENTDRAGFKTSLRGDLRNATVYDASGTQRACGPIETNCPQKPRDVAFQDQCRAAGFQVRTCGCDDVCSGDFTKHVKQFFDANGSPSACDEPEPSCDPPPASAAFQDACAEKGHRLKVCGCAWLCSGNPVK